MARVKEYMYDTFFQWIATGRWSSPSTPVYPNNKTDRQDITEIPLIEKVEDTEIVSQSRMDNAKSVDKDLNLVT
jgi:hypothetical protein